MTDSAISLPTHPLLEAMGKKENEGTGEDSTRKGDPLSLLLPVSLFCLGLESDHTMTPEKLQLVTADQQTPEYEIQMHQLSVIGHPQHLSSESSDQWTGGFGHEHSH